MALAPRAPIGQRLKAGRREKTLTQRALAAGADLFITKPYSNQDLIDHVLSLAP